MLFDHSLSKNSLGCLHDASYIYETDCKKVKVKLLSFTFNASSKGQSSQSPGKLK